MMSCLPPSDARIRFISARLLRSRAALSSAVQVGCSDGEYL